MGYILAQTFGILAAACCFLGPLFKEKWQMLLNAAVANILTAVNFALLGELGSGIVMNGVAVVQIAFSLWHIRKNTKVTIVENIVFLILYVGLGALGYRKPIDILPISGAAILMFSIFQRDEQKTRVLYLGNAFAWITYDLLIGSSAALSQLATIGTTSAALYKYRKQKSRG